jgi:hypothetical protein
MGLYAVDAATGNQHAPLRNIKTKSSTKPWITNDLKELMAERDAFKLAKRSGNHEHWINYCRLKNFVNRKIKPLKLNIIND